MRCPRAFWGQQCLDRRRIPDLLKACLYWLIISTSLWRAECQYNFDAGTDIGVHRIFLYRRGGPEDKDQARKDRNVLVSCEIKDKSIDQAIILIESPLPHEN